MATQAQCDAHVKLILPLYQKYGQQKRNVDIISFAMAQSCFESGWGTDLVAPYNICGITPTGSWGVTFSSYDDCVDRGYYEMTALGKMVVEKNPQSLDEYFNLFVASGYYGNSAMSAQQDYYEKLKWIINKYDMTQYDFAHGGGVSELFDYENTRADAILREAAYLNKSYEPSKQATNVKLSIANYTDLFAAYWRAGAGVTVEYDYSKLDKLVMEAVEYLVSQYFNNAAACGICACIQYLSEFKTNYSKDRESYVGLCAWPNERGQAMIKHVGSKWKDNLTKQLEYLIIELTEDYDIYLSNIRGYSNTKSGAKAVARAFAQNMRLISNYSDTKVIEELEKQAEEYFDAIVKIVQSPSADGLYSGVALPENLKNLPQARRERLERAYAMKDKTDKGQLKYVWGGTGQNYGSYLGFDCSGFVSYCLTGELESRVGNTETFMGWPTATNPQPGDVCTNWQHCGMYIGDGQMLHCTSSPGNGVIQGGVQSGMKIVTYK